MPIPYVELRRDINEIRLLELLPSGGPQYARIPCCRLLQTGLREAPSYNALSYAWGSPETNRVILVNNVGIRIPQNLFDALIALRPSQPESSMLIWVDYLCINQRNNVEKAWQVSLMGDLYKQADQVLAWLGPGNDASRKAIEYLNEFGKDAHLCGFHHTQYVGNPLWEELAILCSTRPGDCPLDSYAAYATQLRNLGVILGHPAFALACETLLRLINLFHKISPWNNKGKNFPIREMKHVLERPWFTRVWVLQEIALSKRAVFVCGTERIDRTRLCAAMNASVCLRQCMLKALLRSKRPNLLASQIFRELFFRATMMVNAHRIMRGPQFPLLALLRLTCVGSTNNHKHGPHHLDSSDPRDKIFALLGLASDRDDLIDRGVIPDYTKSHREVYTMTTSALLQQGHLSLLSFVQPQKSSAQRDLPSWVPDWYQPLTAPLQIVYDDHMILRPEFRASGVNHSNSVIKVDCSSPDISRISLEGYAWDKVHSVGFFPRRVASWNVPLEETFSWPKEWLVEILRLSYQIEGIFPSFKERLHTVARASVGGVLIGPQGEVSRPDENILFEAEDLLSINLIKYKHIEAEARRFLAQSKKSSGWMVLGTMARSIMARCLKRVPFITSTGKLGLGYDNIRAGDVVTIIRGAQVPYVLRLQHDGTYNLISEAYVDGIMDGEALRGATFTWLHLV
ncbi:hypothetical protein NUW58_g1804 [Xylaria curta]|uniref:Uncharacterized protein n=1 Tax=Xylaria curta TaxID=42375 RepID=A0ACC1PLB3_9PEZI|nr:hypothetical protein NUW58_g1804 [Xylaria curta]